MLREKKVVSLVMIVLGLAMLLSHSSFAATLDADCTLAQNSCAGGWQQVFSVSDNGNAHVSYKADEYDWKVCCRGTDLGSSSQACSVEQSIFRMTSETNAQVEYKTLASPGYNNYACLGTDAFNCTYETGGCTAPLKCVVSISSSTNAHVGDCSAYPIKVCCQSAASFPDTCSDEDESCGTSQSCCSNLYCSNGRCCPNGEQWDGSDCVVTNTVYPSSIYGRVSHTVVGIDEWVNEATVTVLGDSMPVGGFWAMTNATGHYNIGVYDNQLYDVVASKPYHEPNVTNVQIGTNEDKESDFHLYFSSSTCNSDCTRNNNVCDLSCAFWNGCFFGSEEVKLACNGKQKGQIVQLGGSFYECCTGTQVTPSNLVPELQVDGEVSDIHTVTRVVMYQGKPVKVKINIYNKK